MNVAALHFDTNIVEMKQTQEDCVCRVGLYKKEEISTAHSNRDNTEQTKYYYTLQFIAILKHLP